MDVLGKGSWEDEIREAMRESGVTRIGTDCRDPLSRFAVLTGVHIAARVARQLGSSDIRVLRQDCECGCGSLYCSVTMGDRWSPKGEDR